MPTSPTLEANQTHLNTGFSPCGADKQSLPVLDKGTCDDRYFDEFMSFWNSCPRHNDSEKLEPRGLAAKGENASLVPVEESFSGWENGGSTTFNFLSDHLKGLSNVPINSAAVELEREFNKSDMEKVRRHYRYVKSIAMNFLC